MKATLKRLIALVLVMAMSLSLLSSTVWASEGDLTSDSSISIVEEIPLTDESSSMQSSGEGSSGEEFFSLEAETEDKTTEEITEEAESGERSSTVQSTDEYEPENNGEEIEEAEEDAQISITEGRDDTIIKKVLRKINHCCPRWRAVSNMGEYIIW